MITEDGILTTCFYDKMNGGGGGGQERRNCIFMLGFGGLNAIALPSFHTF